MASKNVNLGQDVLNLERFHGFGLQRSLCPRQMKEKIEKKKSSIKEKKIKANLCGFIIVILVRVNPLSDKSDQHRISPCIINAL